MFCCITWMKQEEVEVVEGAEDFHPDPAQAIAHHPDPDMYLNFLEVEFLPKASYELPFC